MAAPSNLPSILYIGVGAPWSGGAGYLVRQNMFLCALAECARLHLALFNYDAAENPSPPFEASITPLSLPPREREPFISSWLRDAFSPMPEMLRHWNTSHARQSVSQLGAVGGGSDAFDAVFSYRIDFAHFAGVLHHPRLLLDIDDPEHLRRLERAHTIENGKLDWFTKIDLRRLRNYERKAAARASAAFVCQKNDQDAFNDPKPIIVPNCVEVPEECPPRNADAPVILFVGNLEGSSETPNVDGLNWFLQHVWPLVLQRVPACELQIVGSVRTSLRDEISRHPHVRVLGFVDCVEDVLMRASLSLAPIRFGTGTRLKILQSMAGGCPVVTTPKGCEGLEVSHSREVLIGSTPNEFAECCIQLLADKTRQEELARAAHASVSANYDRNRRQAGLVTLLQASIEKASKIKV